MKWVCGFANAQGGTSYIGINDMGKVVGVKDVKKLMDDIPNQIQSGLGVIADVKKRKKDGLDYIEIKVNPSTYPINYRGEYHYWSGSTRQQFQRAALTEFIREKTVYPWDVVSGKSVSPAGSLARQNRNIWYWAMI